MPLILSFTKLTIALDEFGMAAGILIFGIWLAWCLRGRGWKRISTALEAWTLFIIICTTTCLISFAAGTSQREFFDPQLAQADRILLPMFDWSNAVISFSASGIPVRIANQVYDSIGWQPQLLIAVHAMMAAHHRIWNFLLSWITTLCVVVVVFALCPVVGAYQHFGILAVDVPAMLDPTPWNQPILLDALRNGTLRVISLKTLDGIINYPSFHAGAAVLLAYSFWQIRVIRWPFVVLNALMLASAVPIGGHYIVDLVAGVITAFVGIAAAIWILGHVRESSCASRPPFAEAGRDTIGSHFSIGFRR